ncbi:hypothetical protein IAE51_11475 [Lactococcus sp. S64]|nr:MULTISPECIES: hypothetical protein [Lactococcus]MBK0084510.1 hypothetical protein [Lactococcus sp. S64]MDG4967454.1 hypothetical protein [Lactococcus lactis]
MKGKEMQKHFLKEKIEIGFDQERELLAHDSQKKKRTPLLFYVRPIYFFILITSTLAALGINGFMAIKYFITH